MITVFTTGPYNVVTSAHIISLQCEISKKISVDKASILAGMELTKANSFKLNKLAFCLHVPFKVLSQGPELRLPQKQASASQGQWCQGSSHVCWIFSGLNSLSVKDYPITELHKIASFAFRCALLCHMGKRWALAFSLKYLHSCCNVYCRSSLRSAW